MSKINWGRLAVAVPTLAGVACIYAVVETALAGEYQSSVFMLTALAVNVFSFVAIWAHTKRGSR